MADVNKSVEIQYRADLKQLLAQLKKIPSITDTEARSMVTNLNKQFRQAEKAAARAAKTTEKSFDRMGKAANRASINARGLRKDFANIDRLSSEASQALMVFSPALGEAAAQASTFAGAAESAGRAMMVSNPLFLAAAVAAGLAFVAYQAFTAESELLAEESKRLNRVLRLSREEIDKQSEAADKAKESFQQMLEETEDLRNEIKMLNGEISEFDLKRLGVDEQVLQRTKSLTEERDKQTDALLAQRSALLEQERAQKKQVAMLFNQKDALTTSDEEALFMMKRLVEVQRQRVKTTEQITQINIEINKTIGETNRKIKETAAEEKALLEEKIKIEEAEKRRKENERARNKEAADALKKQKEEERKLQEIQRGALDIQKQRESLQIKNLQTGAKLASKEAEISAQLGIQKKLLNDQISAAEERAKKAQAEAETDEQKKAARETELESIQLIAEAKEAQQLAEMQAEQQLAKLREKNNNDAIKAAEERAAKEKALAQEIHTASTDLILSIGDLRAAQDKQSEGNMLRLFRFSQAAAIGDIAFSVAKGIADAAGLPPGLRAAQIATVIATGGAQTAKVMAQAPPTADMGMIGNRDPLRPDEQMVRVLRGEAVLDRATVESLGGESGVRSLKGQQQPQVVVLQPFKHFDRFIKRNRIDGGNLATAGARTRY